MVETASLAESSVTFMVLIKMMMMRMMMMMMMMMMTRMMMTMIALIQMIPIISMMTMLMTMMMMMLSSVDSWMTSSSLVLRRSLDSAQLLEQDSRPCSVSWSFTWGRGQGRAS